MIENEKYNVTGMSCAACVSHVDKAVRNIDGVKDVSVNLLTNSMLVTHEDKVTPEIISKAVSAAGYQAEPADKKKTVQSDDEFKDTETPKLLKRLILSLILLIPLFYISMGSMMDWPIGYLKENPLMLGLVEMMISFVIMLINRKFFISGTKSVLHGSPNMDTLVALGSSVAFIYSTVMMFVMCFYAKENDWTRVMEYSMTLSYETSGMVPTLITIGKTLESYSKGKTTNAIKDLLNLSPKTATVIRDGKETVIPAEDVLLNDTFLVKPGESFPVDGVVIEGISSVDESALTGESMPVDKQINDKIYAATINQNGALTCKAVKVGEETTLHQIVKMVETASGTKTKISEIADRVSGIFVPTVLSIALIVFICWLIFGGNFVTSLNSNSTTLSYAIERGISVLVISCPCALGLATPVAIMVGNGVGAKNGILFKNAVSLEETGKIDYIVLDKTGTITKGEPTVTDIHSLIDENELLQLTASVEAKSEHPLAKAILKKAEEKQISSLPCTDFEAEIGKGVKGLVNGHWIEGTNIKSVTQNSLTEKLKIIAEGYAAEGKTPIVVTKDGNLIGIVAVADIVKEDSKEAIEELKALGITPVMLTGDNERTAKAIASQVGIEAVVSDVLPDQKQETIKKLQQYGKVAMVGDGINDAPSLTQADIGIAIGAGSDIAIDSADVILMHSSLKDAVKAIRLSRQTLKNIKENLFWAFFYNLVMIPIAAGAFSAVGLAKLKPWYGAAAMSLSSVTVVLNALRLNLFKTDKKTKSHKAAKPLPEEFFTKKEETAVIRKSIVVSDMMCENCVRHVKETLEKIDGVIKADVSLEKLDAVVTLSKNVEDETLTRAIKDEGYIPGEIKTL